jgi:hypothetical protein
MTIVDAINNKEAATRLLMNLHLEGKRNTTTGKIIKSRGTCE